jgi:hypothetical protein
LAPTSSLHLSIKSRSFWEISSDLVSACRQKKLTLRTAGHILSV